MNKDIHLDNVENLFLDISNKLGQSVNIDSDVQFSNLNVTENMNIDQDLSVGGIIRGNVIDTSNTGISVSSPTMGIFPISDIQSATQLNSSLRVFSATYASLDFVIRFTTLGTSNNPVLEISAPGISVFESTNRDKFTIFADIFEETSGVRSKQIVSTPIINTRKISIVPLVDNSQQTYILNCKLVYSFIQSPSLVSFAFSNYSSGLNQGSQEEFISFLLTSLSSNTIDLSLEIQCTTFNQIESFELLLPNRIDNFVDKVSVFSLTNGIHKETNVNINNFYVESVIGTNRAKISFLSNIGTLFLNIQINYRNTQ